MSLHRTDKLRRWQKIAVGLAAVALILAVVPLLGLPQKQLSIWEGATLYTRGAELEGFLYATDVPDAILLRTPNVVEKDLIVTRLRINQHQVKLDNPVLARVNARTFRTGLTLWDARLVHGANRISLVVAAASGQRKIISYFFIDSTPPSCEVVVSGSGYQIRATDHESGLEKVTYLESVDGTPIEQDSYITGGVTKGVAAAELQLPSALPPGVVRVENRAGLRSICRPPSPQPEIPLDELFFPKNNPPFVPREATAPPTGSAGPCNLQLAVIYPSRFDDPSLRDRIAASLRLSSAAAGQAIGLYGSEFREHGYDLSNFERDSSVRTFLFDASTNELREAFPDPTPPGYTFGPAHSLPPLPGLRMLNNQFSIIYAPDYTTAPGNFDVALYALLEQQYNLPSHSVAVLFFDNLTRVLTSRIEGFAWPPTGLAFIDLRRGDPTSFFQTFDRLSNTTTHEIGHLLGFAHTEEVGSLGDAAQHNIMRPGIGPPFGYNLTRAQTARGLHSLCSSDRLDHLQFPEYSDNLSKYYCQNHSLQLDHDTVPRQFIWGDGPQGRVGTLNLSLTPPEFGGPGAAPTYVTQDPAGSTTTATRAGICVHHQNYPIGLRKAYPLLRRSAQGHLEVPDVTQDRFRITTSGGNDIGLYIPSKLNDLYQDYMSLVEFDYARLTSAAEFKFNFYGFTGQSFYILTREIPAEEKREIVITQIGLQGTAINPIYQKKFSADQQIYFVTVGGVEGLNGNGFLRN